jgi:hypothetical protein
MMKRQAKVAAVIWCSLGCGAAEDRAADGSGAANSRVEATRESSQVSIERRICDGSTCAPRAAVADAGAAFLWDGRGRSSCADDSFDATAPLRAELYEVGNAVTGPIRIQVGKGFYAEAPIVYEWPLAAPVEQFVIEYGETRSFRIDDVADAAALRLLRDQAIEDSEASARYLDIISISASEGNESYFMSLRDDLSLVGADGSWLPAR